MTRAEVAQALRITTRTVDVWLRDPQVPLRAVKLGHLVRIPASDVEALLTPKEPAAEPSFSRPEDYAV
jgi:excisionase family DNA binding protein